MIIPKPMPKTVHLEGESGNYILFNINCFSKNNLKWVTRLIDKNSTHLVSSVSAQFSRRFVSSISAKITRVGMATIAMAKSITGRFGCNCGVDGEESSRSRKRLTRRIKLIRSARVLNKSGDQVDLAFVISSPDSKLLPTD